jgi:hypothetical protein
LNLVTHACEPSVWAIVTLAIVTGTIQYYCKHQVHAHALLIFTPTYTHTYVHVAGEDTLWIAKWDRHRLCTCGMTLSLMDNVITHVHLTVSETLQHASHEVQTWMFCGHAQ